MGDAGVIFWHVLDHLHQELNATATYKSFGAPPCVLELGQLVGQGTHLGGSLRVLKKSFPVVSERLQNLCYGAHCFCPDTFGESSNPQTLVHSMFKFSAKL